MVLHVEDLRLNKWVPIGTHTDFDKMRRGFRGLIVESATAYEVPLMGEPRALLGQTRAVRCASTLETPPVATHR